MRSSSHLLSTKDLDFIRSGSVSIQVLGAGSMRLFIQYVESESSHIREEFGELKTVAVSAKKVNDDRIQ